jgi:hypothetical protein
MPHTSYALLKGIRSHQIESPSAAASALHGVPNACNLCHLDRTLAWTGEHLHRWYGHEPVVLTDEQRTVSAALLWLLKGHAAQRVIASWHFGWGPAHEASGADWLAPFQAQLLADPYGVVRYVAEHNLRQLPGFEAFRYDFLASTNEWRSSIDLVRDRWNHELEPPGRRGADVLIDSEGRVMWDHVVALLQQRDNREVIISE